MELQVEDEGEHVIGGPMCVAFNFMLVVDAYLFVPRLSLILG